MSAQKRVFPNESRRLSVDPHADEIVGDITTYYKYTCVVILSHTIVRTSNIQLNSKIKLRIRRLILGHMIVVWITCQKLEAQSESPATDSLCLQSVNTLKARYGNPYYSHKSMTQSYVVSLFFRLNYEVNQYPLGSARGVHRVVAVAVC